MTKKERAKQDYIARLHQFNTELYNKYLELRELLAKAPSSVDPESYPYNCLNYVYESYCKAMDIYGTTYVSRVVVDDFFRITLPYYRLELKLQPLQKTLFLFYLLHPEGMPNSDIEKYKDELTKIYKEVSHYINLDYRDDAIKSLLDNEKSWSKNLNKLNTAIDEQLKEKHDDANLYYHVIYDQPSLLHMVLLDKKKIFLNDFLKKLKKETSPNPEI